MLRAAASSFGVAAVGTMAIWFMNGLQVAQPGIVVYASGECEQLAIRDVNIDWVTNGRHYAH